MNSVRIKTLTYTILMGFIVVLGRTFYWQIIKYEDLNQKIIFQNYKAVTKSAIMGRILDSQNNPLALNQDFYKISIYKPELKSKPEDILSLLNENDKEQFNKFISNNSQKWITLRSLYNYEEKNKFKDPGITFTTTNTRYYPEDQTGKTIISGLENYYQKLLNGKPGFSWENKDAIGQTLLNHSGWYIDAINGTDINTSLNREVQALIESTLELGVKKYTADSGSISIISPESGEIIAMASYESSPSAFIKNPVISNLFEPGSIFKPLVVSMALDNKSIDTNYICNKCDRPRVIGQYTITNWDNSLHPNSTLEDIIKNSDNIGMSYIIGKLGLNNFLSYFKLLGLDRKTGIDLKAEAKPIPKNFSPEIDFANASFGQGFAITQIQMLTAFNTIANDGIMTQPHFFKNKKDLKTVKVFDNETALKIKKILKYAVENGVVAKFKPDDLEVCAKSGTAQIAVNGSYSDASTIASYIGFSPCNKPKFTMIVTINNPRTSPWGSSTAAPIWYEIAKNLQLLL